MAESAPTTSEPSPAERLIAVQKRREGGKGLLGLAAQPVEHLLPPELPVVEPEPEPVVGEGRAVLAEELDGASGVLVLTEPAPRIEPSQKTVAYKKTAMYLRPEQIDLMTDSARASDLYVWVWMDRLIQQRIDRVDSYIPGHVPQGPNDREDLVRFGIKFAEPTLKRLQAKAKKYSDNDRSRLIRFLVDLD